jgi:hypothetical protein
LIQQDRPIPQPLIDLMMSRRSAIEGTQASHQLFIGERLDQIVVSPRVEPGDSIRRAVSRSQHQDGEALAGPAETSRHLDARDVGQSEVEDHRLYANPRHDDLDGIEPVIGHLDDMAVALEHPPQRAAEAGVILNHQQAHRPSLRRDL